MTNKRWFSSKNKPQRRSLFSKSGEPCPTRKYCYPNKGMAKTTGATLRAQDGTERYVYKCPECKSWHLTSKSSWGRNERA